MKRLLMIGFLCASINAMDDGALDQALAPFERVLPGPEKLEKFVGGGSDTGAQFMQDSVRLAILRALPIPARELPVSLLHDVEGGSLVEDGVWLQSSGGITIFDSKTGMQLDQLSAFKHDNIRRSDQCSHGDFIFKVCISDHARYVIEMRETMSQSSDRGIQTLRGHSDRIVSVDFDSKGKRLLSVGRDKMIRIWEFKDFCQSDGWLKKPKPTRELLLMAAIRESIRTHQKINNPYIHRFVDQLKLPKVLLECYRADYGDKTDNSADSCTIS